MTSTDFSSSVKVKIFNEVVRILGIFLATPLKGRFFVFSQQLFCYFQHLPGALTLLGNHLTQYNNMFFLSVIVNCIFIHIKSNIHLFYILKNYKIFNKNVIWFNSSLYYCTFLWFNFFSNQGEKTRKNQTLFFFSKFFSENACL